MLQLSSTTFYPEYENYDSISTPPFFIRAMASKTCSHSRSVTVTEHGNTEIALEIMMPSKTLFKFRIAL